MLLKNATIYNDQFETVKQNITIEGERIMAIDNRETDDTVLDLAGYTVLPGLVDIHIHGCAGHDTGEATEEAILNSMVCASAAKDLAGNTVHSLAEYLQAADSQTEA